MNITEVRVKLVGDNRERLQAFCTLTVDGDFVIRDLKVIEGPNGPFVAMPSRKLAGHCPKCGGKNHLRAHFCNDCGARIGEGGSSRRSNGRTKLHADVAHPINAACREQIQKVVIEAYRRETELANQPGYQPKSWDDDEADSSDYEALVADLKQTMPARQASGSNHRLDIHQPAPPLDRGPAEAPIHPDSQRKPPSPEAESETPAPQQTCTQVPTDEGFSSGIL